MLDIVPQKENIAIMPQKENIGIHKELTLKF